MGNEKDALDDLVRELHGRDPEPRDWLGGSRARVLTEAATEIARLRAEVERQARALAAGPAALREIADRNRPYLPDSGAVVVAYDRAATEVEAAQARALKGDGT